MLWKEGIVIKVDIKDLIKKYLLVVAGIMLTGIGISMLFVPNKIVNGGVSGVSTILYHTLKIPAGLSFAVINLILLVFSYRFLGKKFVINSLFGAGLVSVFVHIFSYFPPITDNILLGTVFGAVLYGFGIGLTLVCGFTTGGTDILGRLIQHFFPHIKIGKILLIVDSMVITASLIVFRDVELVLFGIMSLFVSTYAIDFLIHKLNISKLAFVISEKGDEISKLLISTSKRGVTIFDVMGAYTMENKKLLMCALKENEIVEFQNKILEVDKDAFIIFSESQQIVGNGFHVYK